MLGFRPVDARKGENRIVVKVKRNRVTVTHRRGFASDGGARPMNGLYLADVLLNDVPQTGLTPVMEIVHGQVRARLPMKQIAAQLGGETLGGEPTPSCWFISSTRPVNPSTSGGGRSWSRE